MLTSRSMPRPSTRGGTLTTLAPSEVAFSTGFGGVLASKIGRCSAIAYIDETGAASPINAWGALAVSATDGSGIYSSMLKLVSSAIVTSDGGTGALDASLDGSPPLGAVASNEALGEPFRLASKRVPAPPSPR